ncbi:MAG: hypothetical protein N2484_09185 [Clostridia bacterium]|nr:hypothetical protein [Clostridia bacterium]
MGKFLVVCYSRSGHTKRIGQEIAKRIGADFEEIIDTKNRKGIIGFITSGRDAMKKNLTVIQPAKYNPAKYDAVIIGTPVWASTISSPVLTYLKERAKEFKKVSFFFTAGGDNNDIIFEQMKEYCGKSPVSTFGITRAEVKKGAYLKRMEEYIRKLS